MKSILHLKEDTEYQIPLREAGKNDRAKLGANGANPKVEVKKETEAEKAADVEKANDKGETAATQSQDNPTDKKETDEISQEEVNLKNLEKDSEDTKNQGQSSPEENSSGTTTESVPPADTAKAALDEMKKLASQEGVIHPSLFISNFSKILGLMERAMQLQVKESGSATEESGSVTKEATEQAEIPAKDK